MSYEKIDNTQFKKIVSKEVVYNINGLKIKKQQLEESLANINELISEAEKLNVTGDEE
jgi:paraquat-inducible protein B